MNKIIEVVSKYKDVPYFYKGRGFGGIDCGGTFIKVVNALIDENYEFKDYGANPNPRVFTQQLSNYADLVRPPEIAGDVLLINIYGLPQHIAFYTGKNTILHTYAAVGRLIEEKYTKYWQDKLHSIYRLRI